MKAPKIGLSKSQNRPKLYQKRASHIKASTPKNSLGFFVTDEDNDESNEVGGDANKKMRISSEMEPFIMKTKPGDQIN